MTSHGTPLHKIRHGRLTLVMISAGISLLLGLTMLPAHSIGTITPSDFPAKAGVKAAMNGKGTWRVGQGEFRAVGARPVGCRSDKQMLSFRKARSKSFSGREARMPSSVWSGAEIVVLRYSDVGAARAAVQRNASYPRRCPRVTEWVCTECDGIWTTWRTRVPAARIGAQSVAWRFRQVGNFKSNGYAVVARKRATVVRVTVDRLRDVFAPNGWQYPRRIKKQVALRLARTALRKAT